MSADDSEQDKAIRSRIQGIESFVREGVWDLDYRNYDGPRRFFVRQLQVFLIAFKGMKDDEFRLRASGLTLITLLSLVPFLAVVFWVFKAFGGVEDLRERVEPFLYENLAVGAQEEAIEWLNRFIDQVHTGALGGISTGVLIVAAIGLLTSIEQSFNKVWGVSQGRSWLSRLVIYWFILTVGPILLAASLAGTVAITTFLPLPSGILAVLLSSIPLVITLGAFTLLYTVLPNTNVQVKNALVGGLTAGVLFETAKLIYAWVSANLFQYHAIYGSLGAIPVFIIWVNIAWVILLFGCEICFANQNVVTIRHERRARSASQQIRELVAARSMLEVGISFYRGEMPLGAASLAQRLDLPVRLVRRVLDTLVSSGLILQTSGVRNGLGYVPSKVISQISIADVVWAMRFRQQEPIELVCDERNKALKSIMERADGVATEIHAETNYLDLARRLLGEDNGS